MSGITDKMNRPIRDLRISVTDQCNLRCDYCMPKEVFGDDYPFLDADELLTNSEIVRLAASFAELGVEKLRLTGGEPLLKKDLPQLIANLAEINGINDIALTTNAILLPRRAAALKAAGLQRVNISLDAIEDDVFKRINGRNVSVKPVLKGIEAAQRAGLAIKINMVVKKDWNENQILPMAAYFKKTAIPLRFIEFMDVGNHNGWNLESVVTRQQIVDRISEVYPITAREPAYFGEVAGRYTYKDGEGEFGVISSVTQSFCSSCTRIRLSADGKLYTCLFAEAGFDMKEILRNNTDENELRNLLVQLWKNRDDRYSDLRLHHTKKRNKIEMSYIGG